MTKLNRAAFLCNFVFLTGLALLAVNDHFFKEAYSNWWTGKLSDFAGVLLLPLFLKYLTGWRDSIVVGLTAIFFLWWKSAYSTSAIDYFNSLELLPITRIIDASDFLAFLVLPLSLLVLRRPEVFILRFPVLRANQFTRYIILPVSLFFFVATSVDEEPFSLGTNESCCAQEPVDVLVGNGAVYIPSAFTPDGDGLNDVFQIVVDTNIVLIDSFRVYTLPDSIIVFSVDSVAAQNLVTGFDGQVFGQTPSASYAFAVRVTAANGSSRLLKNQVCALPCPTPATNPGPAFIRTCTFGDQLDEHGRFDRSITTAETLGCY